jgi:hypothetical protein
MVGTRRCEPNPPREAGGGGSLFSKVILKLGWNKSCPLTSTEEKKKNENKMVWFKTKIWLYILKVVDLVEDAQSDETRT